MKVLLKGFGSIGKRHTRNLLSLGYTEIAVISSKSELEEEFAGLKIYHSIEEALQQETFTHGFICSPTAFHAGDLTSFIDSGIKHIYLEKPVSHTWEGCEELLERIHREQISVQVGFDLHFDPGLLKVKEIIDAGMIGQVYSANAFVGQYLPDWRPYEDHRQGMSAFRAKGGGVMLDLVHEFDYLRWLLGEPKRIAAFYQNNPQLEIETEDIADVLIQFSQGASASIHLDYHQRSLIRFCIFTGERGSVKWDLAARSLTLTKGNGDAEIFDFSSWERNDRYVQIVQSFMSGSQDPRLTSLREGLVSLKMVLEAKRSSEQLSMIEIKTI